MTQYLHGPNREAERLRVIIESIAFTDPDMRMEDAAPAIFEIEKRTRNQEAVQFPAPAIGGLLLLPDQTPQTIAKFIDIQPDIQALIPTKKINAIKEVRSRAAVGLKEAKEGVEYWASSRATTKPGAPAAPTPPGGSSTSPSDIAAWIDSQPDIIDLITGVITVVHPSSGLIHAIKETRARYPGAPGLREAKDGVEEWKRTRPR